MIEAPTAIPAKRTVLRALFAVLLPVAALYLAASLTTETVHVLGSSMMPTLSSGDLLVASKIDYRLHPPERGDIVVLQNPGLHSEDYIKRVVGMPGDHVLIRDGHIYINGSELVEPYVNQPWSLTRSLLQTPTASDGQIVPPDSYFVLGDNRDHSNDSRTFGYISRDQIEEKAWLRFWPAGTAGFLGVRPYFASRLNAA